MYSRLRQLTILLLPARHNDSIGHCSEVSVHKAQPSSGETTCRQALRPHGVSRWGGRRSRNEAQRPARSLALIGEGVEAAALQVSSRVPGRRRPQRAARHSQAHDVCSTPMITGLLLRMPHHAAAHSFCGGGRLRRHLWCGRQKCVRLMLAWCLLAPCHASKLLQSPLLQMHVAPAPQAWTLVSHGVQPCLQVTSCIAGAHLSCRPHKAAAVGNLGEAGKDEAGEVD